MTEQNISSSMSLNKCAVEIHSMSALQEGAKYDAGKLRFDLLPVVPLEQLSAVYTMGAQKYADRNWEKGIKYSRIFAAIMRHLWAFWRGESYDKESGLPHPAHAAWGCFALMQYMLSKPEFDDRVLEVKSTK